MDINWQWANPTNPSTGAIGPAGYDDHLYYNFGVSAIMTWNARILS